MNVCMQNNEIENTIISLFCTFSSVISSRRIEKCVLKILYQAKVSIRSLVSVRAELDLNSM